MNNWMVGATHQAFGREGMKRMYGSRETALKEARRIAKAGGHGWKPVLEVVCLTEIEIDAEIA